MIIPDGEWDGYTIDLYEAAKRGEIFEENGHFGLRDSDGYVLLDPVYDVIDWKGERLRVIDTTGPEPIERWINPNGTLGEHVGFKS